MNKHDIVFNELKKLTARLSSAEGDVRVYLYGSRSRQDASEDSDWDILVLIKDSLLDSHSFERYAFPFSELGWHFDAQITPILFTENEWTKERNTLFSHTYSSRQSHSESSKS